MFGSCEGYVWVMRGLCEGHCRVITRAIELAQTAPAEFRGVIVGLCLGHKNHQGVMFGSCEGYARVIVGLCLGHKNC